MTLPKYANILGDKFGMWKGVWVSFRFSRFFEDIKFLPFFEMYCFESSPGEYACDLNDLAPLHSQVSFRSSSIPFL